MDNQHYICAGGCGGEADEPGVCKSEACPDRNKPFKECGCADRKHNAADKKEN